MRKEWQFRRQFLALCSELSPEHEQWTALQLILDKDELDTVQASYSIYHPQGWTLYREACILLTDAIPF